jgi:hypothetical protein
MGEAARPLSLRRPLPAWLNEAARALEPLWIASTASLFVIWGYDLIPRAIRALGHSGRTETIEWAVYMSMLVAYPVTCIVIALAVPRIFKGEAATVVKAFVVLAAIVCGIVYVANGRLAFAAVALVPAMATALMAPGAYRTLSERPLEGIISLVVIGLVALIAWMCAGGLVYWTRASQWFLSSPMRALAIVIAGIAAITGLPRLGPSREVKAAPGVAFRIASAFVLLLLIVFSFRTNPMVEFYHWSFWVGPIEQLRQGGWLLYDTPSQYGFLSILVPAALPGSAWISFWYYQAAVYAITSVLMYVIFRRLRGGVGNLVLSFLVVFTTLFFRPRSATLILPAQMTPSGGPVRFLWCFVLLGWLLFVFREAKGRRDPGAGFPLVGHIIWVSSIAWSFEAAIYSSAIWFAAFTVFLVQRVATEKREGKPGRAIAVGVVRSLLVPVALVIALYLIVWAVYRVVLGIPPDLQGYTEFGLLYSSGFGSLPIDTHGAIWYLLLVFFIASTVVVQFLVEDWRDFRLVVAAGVWGGVWSLSSYFVSRSHPVNLLSITPALLFAVAVLMIVVRHSTRRPWHGYVRAATVPILALPIAMTLGHPGLGEDLRTDQLAPHKFTEQLPFMDPALEALLREAGAKPDDPVVRIVDGRLMLPAWRGDDGSRLVSARSWLPKPYEIIGSLPEERRRVYLERNARNGLEGWLVHNRANTIDNFDERFAEIRRTHEPARKYERGDWIIWYMKPLAQSGGSTHLSPR